MSTNISTINVPEGVVYSQSIVEHGSTTYFLIKTKTNEKFLGLIGDTTGFTGVKSANDHVLLCPLTPENAAALRSRLAWLNPVPLGKKLSVGFGDRSGMATPGHINALRAVPQTRPIAPIFAQQSVRENTRIGRTPQQVMDAAIWGILQDGWNQPWGADADHVKELAHLPSFVAAGYTFYTIDPSDHVDNAAQTDSLDTLRTKVANLPWNVLQTTYEETRKRYDSQSVAVAGLDLHFSEDVLLRGLAKYGRAIAHTVAIAEALNTQMGGKTYDLEMSVDETDTPTSVYEHYYIVNELKRLNVPVVSVAPRFVGKFQKGVDYMGDLSEFETELVKHVAIMKHFGSYKLSIHTGSDKFSIYPIIAKHAPGQVHVKTAGTSYLEALRVIAEHDPAFFRRILAFSIPHFEKDRHSYFLDAQLSRVPAGNTVADADLPALIDQFDTRQVLHVTFGSVLEEFRTEFHNFLAAHEAEYDAGLEKHFKRHLVPFSQ